MDRIDTPTEVALFVETLFGTHMRSRRERMSLYGLACLLLLGGLFIGWELWRNGLTLHDWLDGIAVLLALGSVLLVPYLYAAAQVRYHIAHESITSAAPWGFFTWILPTANIIAIAYERGSYNAHYLTFMTASGKTRSIVCIQSIQTALATRTHHLDMPAS